MDLDYGTSAVPLKPKGLLSRSTEFQSSVGLLTWQHDGALANSMSLINAGGNCLARFSSTAFARRKMGKLEVSGEVEWGPGLLDEIVISGVAMAEAERRIADSGSGATAA